MKNVLVFLMIICSLTGFANNNSKSDSIQKLIVQKSFVFEAYSAMPMRGNRISLGGGNELTISGDTLKVHLPYFGVSHTATYHSDELGIKFVSFDYSYKAKKVKHGWDITVKPKDKSGVEMNLFISESGYAILRVTDYRRDDISFNGHISSINK
ncbi:MAG: DUF4251 domain-containing protein [Prevotellaceae bacterium]|jgi:hypothetical protein|nr:DUF4251 domain-containing protein [Prevotellaceae bacterium]